MPALLEEGGRRWVCRRVGVDLGYDACEYTCMSVYEGKGGGERAWASVYSYVAGQVCGRRESRGEVVTRGLDQQHSVCVIDCVPARACAGWLG